MLQRLLGVGGVICAFGLITAACSTRAPIASAAPEVPPPTVATALPPPPAPAPVPVPRPRPQPQPVRDPVVDLIAASTRHFEAGQRELQVGHLEMANALFNQSLGVLLESTYGARTEPRIREHFDSLIERISAVEVAALAQGDGFAERRNEPASIDELLAISTFSQPVPTLETTEAVAEDLQYTTHDIDIPLNRRVLSFVELFSGRLRTYLEDGLGRGTPYLPMIQSVFRAEGIPLDLAYVPLIESAFKPNALSRAKAKGMWQFMRGTALENGLAHDWYIDERADPEKATRAAARYLKTLYGMFGDWHLALASYNGGPGRVQRAMKRSGKGDFWSLTATQAFLPRETRDYVPLILAAIIVARNPEQYGVTVPQTSGDAGVDRVVLPTPVDLRRVAEWTDVPVQTIQELNPELRRWTTPIRAFEYELKVPPGTADLVWQRLVEADPSSLAPLNRHTVKKNETLSSIARKLNVSRADLAEANYLATSAKLQIGQQLIIPRPPTLLLAQTSSPAAPESQHAGAGPDARPAVRAGDASDTTVVHRVRSGETLSSIARLYRTTVALLKQWNSLKSDAILAGQRLTVRPSSTLATN
jgi:membrane-bound lytic murein transglycosylase D